MSTSRNPISIDLNADLGETTGGNPVSDDAAMVAIVSSANVACGFHAGDPHAISSTLAAAAENNVTVGAHVGYNDVAGFGRRFIDYSPAELADEVLYQIGALDALAKARGTQVRYVKPHGAMYNTIVHHEAQAKAVIEGIKAFGADLPVMLLPGAVAATYAERAGLRVINEVFADRVVRMAQEGTIEAIDGTTIHTSADSVCVHGDSPGAVAMAERIAAELKANDITIGSFL